jgi:hypothetical protein
MTRSTTTSPPSAAEILALLTMAGDLREDPRTTDADRLAYFECKADLLERIAAHNRTGAARDAARHARGQVRRLHHRAANGSPAGATTVTASGRW